MEHPPKDKPAAVSPDLWRLASCACNSTLSAEDQTRLEAILAADGRAREFYAFYMLIHADLLWRTRGGPAAEDEIEDTLALLAITATPGAAAPAPADLGPSLGQALAASVHPAWNVLLSYSVSLLIFGIAVLGAFVWSRSDDARIARGVSQPGAASFYVARITKAQGCYPATPGPWEADGLRLRLGYECYVASGELEITYDTGAKVTLQGPAWYEVNSARSGALHHGTAVVSAGEQPDGRSPAPQVAAAREIVSHPLFTLLVPLGVVTNQAAAYSLTVDELGAFYAKVRRGQIALQMPGWGPDNVVAVGSTHSAVAFVQPSRGGGFQWQLTLSNDQPLLVDSNPRSANRTPVVFSGKYHGSLGKDGLGKPPGHGSGS